VWSSLLSEEIDDGKLPSLCRSFFSISTTATVAQIVFHAQAIFAFISRPVSTLSNNYLIVRDMVSSSARAAPHIGSNELREFCQPEDVGLLKEIGGVGSELPRLQLPETNHQSCWRGRPAQNPDWR
jgi:hypothetical protein